MLTRAVDATTGKTTVAQSDNLLVIGWAADVQEGAPVYQVSILIDGVAVGDATLGIADPTIATKYKNPAYDEFGLDLYGTCIRIGCRKPYRAGGCL